MLLEAVPNLSLGPQDDALDTVLEALEPAESPSVRVLDTHTDPDHHRTVLTLAGAPAPLGRCLGTLVDGLLEHASLVDHDGVHPRLGLLDVLPIVPLEDAREQDARALAHRLAQHLAHRSVPSFFYARMATTPKRERLAHHRGILRWPNGPGPLEALPDAGPPRYHARFGACCIGVRDVLVAYNVLLDTNQLEVGADIAAAVRASGGGLPGVQALAFPLAHQGGKVQVSTNITDVHASTIPDVYEAVREKARKAQVPVLRGELVGLAPEQALGPDAASMGLDRRPEPLEARLEAAGLPATIPS